MVPAPAAEAATAALTLPRWKASQVRFRACPPISGDALKWLGCFIDGKTRSCKARRDEQASTWVAIDLSLFVECCQRQVGFKPRCPAGQQGAAAAKQQQQAYPCGGRRQFAVRCVAHLGRVVAGVPLDFVQEAIGLPLHMARRTASRQGQWRQQRNGQQGMLTRSDAASFRAGSLAHHDPSHIHTCGCLNSFEYSSSQYLQASEGADMLSGWARLHNNPWHSSRIKQQHPSAHPPCVGGMVEILAPPLAQDDAAAYRCRHIAAGFVKCHEPDVVPPAPPVPALRKEAKAQHD